MWQFTLSYAGPTRLKHVEVHCLVIKDSTALRLLPLIAHAWRVERSIYLVEQTPVFSRHDGNIPMIGCGGIFTGEDALEYARAGAAMVQLIYASLAYDGPGACRRIKDDIAASLAQTGETWQDVVRKAVAANSWVAPPPAKEVAASPEWTVKELTAEAEELKKLLEAFEGKHTNDIVQPKSASLGVPSSKDSTDATVKQLVAEAEELGKALKSVERKTKAVADYDEDFE